MTKDADAQLLLVERVAIADLSLDPANVRRHPERNLAEIRASLRRFGQRKPVVATRAGTVIAGNGTVMAAGQIGWTHVDVVRTDLQGAEATAYAIADNRTSELASWDQEALANVLGSLEDLEGVGFTQDELTTLLAKVRPEAPEGFPQYDEGLPTTYGCPRCGYRWSGKAHGEASPPAAAG
jgi:ParB-like chromosome segregation protein Spo0J